jgi:serpin B
MASKAKAKRPRGKKVAKGRRKTAKKAANNPVEARVQAPDEAKGAPPAARVIDPAETVLRMGNNFFGAKILSQFQDRKENIFFSPFNIRMALAMVFAGADGETAKQMREVLGFPENPMHTHLVLSRLSVDLEKLSCELGIANNVTVANDEPLHQGFVNVLKGMYRVTPTSVDFKTRYQEIRQEINRWVMAKTKDKIQDLLQDGTVTAATRMILVSAIYFKDAWTRAFDERFTRPGTFSSTEEIEVPFMNDKSHYLYSEGLGFQVLELPYQSGLSMVIFLPTDRSGISDLEKRFCDGTLQVPPGRRQEVVASIPKWRTTYGFSAKDILCTLGMPSAFSNEANFSKMSDTPLKIDNVIHKAFVDVNEQGTEAAAATAVSMVKCTSFMPAPQPKRFIADHPFLFVIREHIEGNYLFMGRVWDPR